MIDFNRLAELASDLGPDAPSTTAFWTDPHISSCLLQAHLDPTTDAASRRPEAIEATVEWLEREVLRGRSRILDLGCGPGLYAEPLARRRHRVTGLDFSGLSVAHARERARDGGLDVEYRVGNYLEEEFGAGHDLAMMVYCDFGALSPADRTRLIRKVRACLAPGGAFVFDVAGPGLAEGFRPSRDWSAQEAGFWSGRRHLLLEDARHFPDLAMIQRTTILAEEDTGRVDRIVLRDWYFSDDELRHFVASAGFSACELHRGFLPRPNWGTGDVVFVVARL